MTTSSTTPTAGGAFNVTVTAQNGGGNTVTNYNGTVHFTSSDGQAVLPADYTFVGADNGSRTFSVTLKTTGSQTVTATDAESATGFATVTVGPGPLGSFTVTSPSGGSIGTQTAGTAFSIKATAFDLYGNLKTDYVGTQSAVLSGNLGSSSKGCDVSGVPTSGGAFPCSPVYGSSGSLGTWTNGVAAASVTAFKAQPAQTLPPAPPNTPDRHLTVTDGTPTGTSTDFAVVANVPAKLTFTQQPADTRCSSSTCSAGSGTTVISTTVKDEDQFGNPEVGVNVKISIDNNPGTPSPGTLGGTNVKATDASGIVSFGSTENLNVDNVGVGYTLKAESPDTSPAASATSAAFNIANAVKQCNGNGCNVTASDPFANASATLNSTGLISITLTPPGDTVYCGNATPGTNVGEVVTVTPTSGDGLLEVSGTLFHRNNKGGVGKTILCKNSGPGTPYHDELPNCNKTKSNAPCLVKLSGNGQGDIFFDLFAKPVTLQDGSPGWDPQVEGSH